MILQRGITGFQHYTEPQISVVDLRGFRTVYHSIARDVAATVIRNLRRNPDTACNFADALLELAGERVVVLLNCFHPLVAFASETDLGDAPEFRDHAELTRAFSTYPDFTVLSTDTLNQMPTTDMIANLAPAEIRQFNYWKPSRLGDVIFNRWD